MSEQTAKTLIIEDLPLAEYCKQTFDSTPDAIRKRIERKQWTLNQEYFKLPNGHIWVILEGAKAWRNRNRLPVGKGEVKQRGQIYQRRGETAVNPYQV